MDRTDNHFEPAVEQLVKEYTQQRVDKPAKFNLNEIPSGVELMYFEVNK